MKTVILFIGILITVLALSIDWDKKIEETPCVQYLDYRLEDVPDECLPTFAQELGF